MAHRSHRLTSLHKVRSAFCVYDPSSHVSPVRTQRDPPLVRPQVLYCVQLPIQMSPPLRDVVSYVGVGISSKPLWRDRSRGSNYRLTSLEGEGLPVQPTVLTQSYQRTHLVPQGLVP